MNRLDRVKVVSRDNKKTVYQLNPRLQLKVIQYDGYCKVYYRVLTVREWAPSSVYGEYTFIATTSSDNISDIFDEVDQLGIMSLQVFTAVQKGDDVVRHGMTFDSIFLTIGEIDSHIKVIKLFDKETDLEDCILGGSPYLRVYPLDGETCVELDLYRPLSLCELVE